MSQAERTGGDGPMRPMVDLTGPAAVLRSTAMAPGWPLAVLALGLSAGTAILIADLAVTAPWLAARLAIGGVLTLALGLVVGSTSLVGLATAPLLAGATIGLDRPEGHAWGQTLLIGLLWYVAAEVAWASIESREATARSRAVDQLRVREVATVVLAAAIVGLGATALANLAPARTVVVRGVVIAVVLACVVGLGQVLTRIAKPDQASTDGSP